MDIFSSVIGAGFQLDFAAVIVLLLLWSLDLVDNRPKHTVWYSWYFIQEKWELGHEEGSALPLSKSGLAAAGNPRVHTREVPLAFRMLNKQDSTHKCKVD